MASTLRRSGPAVPSGSVICSRLLFFLLSIAIQHRVYHSSFRWSGFALGLAPSSRATRESSKQLYAVGGTNYSCDRRSWLVHLSVAAAAFQKPQNAEAKADTSLQQQAPLDQLLEAQDTLDKLLSNWKRATVECIFADVPRELLEAKNKELLLEKASTFALFDKSVSVETCKTTNRIVRDYLGVTGKGPLVGIDKVMRKALGSLPDPDDLDSYLELVEAFSVSLSKAASLSYAAGVADFDSVNNFNKEESDEEDRNENSNLEQSRRAIAEAKTNLDGIIGLLTKG